MKRYHLTLAALLAQFGLTILYMVEGSLETAFPWAILFVYTLLELHDEFQRDQLRQALKRKDPVIDFGDGKIYVQYRDEADD